MALCAHLFRRGAFSLSPSFTCFIPTPRLHFPTNHSTLSIQHLGLLQAKDGAGSATLSMAAAGNRFVGSLLRALKGEKGVSECSFVESPVVPGLPFFATRVELGSKGVEKIQPIGALSSFEKAGLEKALPELKASITKGVEFAGKWAPKA